jgi:hypothetical protein
MVAVNRAVESAVSADETQPFLKCAEDQPSFRSGSAGSARYSNRGVVPGDKSNFAVVL